MPLGGEEREGVNRWASRSYGLGINSWIEGVNAALGDYEGPCNLPVFHQGDLSWASRSLPKRRSHSGPVVEDASGTTRTTYSNSVD